MNTKTLRPDLQLSRLLCDLALGHLHGEDREAVEEFARHGGIEHPDAQRPVIPLAELARGLTVGVAGSGGFLVDTDTQEAQDALRPWSVTARAGIQIETGLTGDTFIPKVTGKATPYWLATEAAQVQPSTPAVQQIVLTPKTIGGLVRFSRQLATQVNAERFVQRELLRTIGTAIDQAILNGLGASGQPLGLLGTPGINSESSASFAHSHAASMKRKVSEADAPDEEIAFLGTPAVRELLEIRERAAGSGFLWDGDRVASRPAFASSDVAGDTLIAGAWAAGRERRRMKLSTSLGMTRSAGRPSASARSSTEPWARVCLGGQARFGTAPLPAQALAGPSRDPALRVTAASITR